MAEQLQAATSIPLVCHWACLFPAFSQKAGRPGQTKFFALSRYHVEDSHVYVVGSNCLANSLKVFETPMEFRQRRIRRFLHDPVGNRSDLLQRLSFFRFLCSFQRRR